MEVNSVCFRSTLLAVRLTQVTTEVDGKTLCHVPASVGLKVSAPAPHPDCRRRSTYDLVLHVPVELVDLAGGHEVVSSLHQRRLEELELVLHADPLAVHLLRAFPLLTEGLRLAPQLLHLLLTHLHLALQDLQEDRLQVLKKCSKM